MPNPSSLRVPALRPSNPKREAAELESIARLVEFLIPNFKNVKERQFYREVVQSYRSAARDIRHQA